MKSQSAALLKTEIEKLQFVTKAINAVVESDEMDADEANELLAKEVENLNEIIEKLTKIV